ncbi:DUF952 domain-containing protein [Mesorhizobium sp. M2E.F.Ca.ET.209.01.1.1]|nr:DUF952 domain-containing protein [Mesorhizobium sp. M2E.F.Ca.ET.209.01.1.1]
MGKSRASSLSRSFGSDYSARMSQIIYKIAPEALWREAEKNGRFTGAPIDLADGFIHFSTAAQVRETAAKHFAGQRGLLLVAVDAAKLGDALKYEVSRGGALFPHLYAPLALDAVLWAKPLPLGAGGHEFPALEDE